MELFKIFGTIALKGQEAFERDIEGASSKGQKLAGVLGKGLATAAKVGVAAVGAAATAVGVLTKKSIESYAEYEQLVGGVNKLFGDNAAEIMKYADNAYKTAGMSANTYMETVTSFSASLISSLGDDTAAAAKVADMAVQDMSDNANVFGTDIASIQNAYQGFAKQNYTMLDNLKLGYGGTKEEMERLLDKADEINAKQGKITEYSIDNLADVYEAIHVVQNEMGITGATANEASTTIQGSINSAKAAYQNWLAALADENADVKAKTDELFNAIGTAANNLLPVVQQVLSSLGQALSTKLPELLANGVAFIVSNLPQLIMLGLQLVMALIEGLAQGFAQLLAMMEAWVQAAIVEPVRAKIEEFKAIVSAGFEEAKSNVLEKFEAIKSGIQEKIDAAKEAVQQAIEAIKGFFDFEWELPHLKLPHISITGKFSLNPPSAPKFGIEWYRKGGILNDPTIFGLNPFTGNAMVGGEAGAEAIAPIDTLKKYVTEAVNDAGSASLLREIVNILSEFKNSGMPINIDITTELDGATVARKLYKYNLLEQRNHGTSLINA